MTNENYEIAISEVLEYLKGIRKEDLEKISPKFMNFLKENASKEYKPNFDYTKPLSELNLLKESKELICFICYKYWCKNETEKIEFYKLLEYNEELYKKEWEEKNKHMFHSKEEKLNSNTEENIKTDKEVSNLPIKESSRIGIFSKIKQFIKNIFRKKK